ncbi:virulence factor SrfC family protein [Lewinella sp. LCG006]|uniref:virulence factor SrfC family protein n=1 Tax=Lewinella sp. LCG006 TaxID=3231911 RepID=UPI003460B602
MNQSQVTLAETCNQLLSVYKEGKQWLIDVPPLELQTSALIELERLSRELERLRKAVLSRPTIAVFGQSQVGKSYLTSNLVKAPTVPDLLIDDPITGEKISFIKEMNPYGGKESTGTVTRFTTAPHKDSKEGYHIKLLSPKDLVCIIVNGYYLDIKKHDYSVGPDELNEQLNQLQKVKQKTFSGIFHAQDFQDIKRYLIKTLGLGSHVVIDNLSKNDFWNRAAALAPNLDFKSSIELCQILWGKQPFLSKLFERLLRGLESVNFATEVFVNKEALTPNTATILDVERVREIYVVSDNENTSVPVRTDKMGQVLLDRRILAALTAEIELPLSVEATSEKNREFLREADVLDFPGARSREHIPEAVFAANTEEAKLQLFIRGKVAYLFDLYNQDYGISTLLYCMHNDNPEVQNIPSLLHNWIASAVGDSKAERSKRINKIRNLVEAASPVKDISPLLVVLTKSDVELTGKSSEVLGQPSSHDGKWVARLEENFKNFMIRPLNDKWVVNWSDEKVNFSHVFPLRNPDFSQAIFTVDKDGNENGISDRYQQKLLDMEVSFLGHDAVNHHIIAPQETWNSFAKPGHTGIEYIIKYLTPTSKPAIKLELLKGAIVQVNREVYELLKSFHTSENIQELLKQANNRGGKAFLYLNLLTSQNNKFGTLLEKILLTEEEAYNCYHAIQNAPVTDNNNQSREAVMGSTQLPLSFVGLLETSGVDTEGSPEEIIQQLQEVLDFSREELEEAIKDIVGEPLEEIFGKSAKEESLSKDLAMIFTDRLITNWIGKVQAYRPTSVDGKQHPLSIIIDELIKSRERIDLRTKVYDAVKQEIDDFSINRKFDVVARISFQVMNNFINTFGWHFIAEKNRPKDNQGRPVFGTNVIDPEKVVPSIDKAFPGEKIADHWRIATREAIKANVLSENKIANPTAVAQNQKLGEIVQKINAHGNEI